MVNGFKKRHFPADFLLPCVRWYLKFKVSYVTSRKMMQERWFEVHDTTIHRLDPALCAAQSGRSWFAEFKVTCLDLLSHL
jgi:hypothetical protein